MKTILIVDNVVTTLIALKELLERLLDEMDLSAEILMASSGPEGFGLITTQTVDILIIDYQMTEISGLQLIKALHEPIGMVKILMTSQRLQVVDRFKVAEEGIDAILEKPVDEKQLRLILQRYVR